MLKQKNPLLRDASEAEDPLKFPDLIQPWNDQLVALGSEIHQARISHVDQLRAHLNPGLFQAEAITIRYKSSLEGRGDLGDYANLLKERLGLRLKNEIAVGIFAGGPPPRRPGNPLRRPRNRPFRQFGAAAKRASDS